LYKPNKEKANMTQTIKFLKLPLFNFLTFNLYITNK
jgi:hypothetical protein